MNSRSTGLSGLIVFTLAGAALVVALFPAGLQHRVRHEWRQKECAERLRMLERLATIRVTMACSRRKLHPRGEARWLAIQGASLVGPAELDLFFCPFQDSRVAPGLTDYRGAASGDWGVEGRPMGADKEDNHPPCCPINVIFGDGCVRPCGHDDPWKISLRKELSP